ncbi:MAG TPA: hypothetical protein VM555_01000, partial [Tahibacter sp.]|nr:hypothetical protein [Tahibacter sp.]
MIRYTRPLLAVCAVLALAACQQESAPPAKPAAPAPASTPAAPPHDAAATAQTRKVERDGYAFEVGPVPAWVVAADIPPQW